MGQTGVVKSQSLCFEAFILFNILEILNILGGNIGLFMQEDIFDSILFLFPLPLNANINVQIFVMLFLFSKAFSGSLHLLRLSLVLELLLFGMVRYIIDGVDLVLIICPEYSVLGHTLYEHLLPKQRAQS